MDFYEVLAKVIELLQREGRASYRALKRQFDLDDEYIEDLQEELIYSKQVARDEDGRVLVWIGEPGVPSEPMPSSTQAAQPEVDQIASTPEQAERRQLTVMFCDLADSTRLSGQLDPEDLRDVIRAYQETAAGVIQRYEGHIAQYLGDGLLVYFGWPQAHEDDARRGVHAGLGIVEAMAGLNTRLEKDKGIHLAVRIGLHTGPVVIGEMGGGGRHERLALGETTNIAARLEGIAQTNTVVVSETTYRLVEGYFACDDLGPHDLKGVVTPMQTYQVRHATGVRGRLDVATTRGLTPLVGRESEVSLLLERWNQAKDGQGQVVLLSGEAGIGKSRLVQVLKDHVAEEPHTSLECRSSPYYQNTALYPFTDLLQRTLQWQQDETPDAKLVKLEQMLGQYQLPQEETVPLFATLLSLPLPEERYPSLPWTPQRQRQKTLEAIVAILLEQAERQPVLFILEDLHWTDPTTLELLGLLIDQSPTASLLTLLTCRSEFAPPWGLRSHLTPIVLNRFTRSQIETMVGRVTDGKTLPAEVMQHLVDKTDGVPLYVEEMTKAILEAGVLQATNGHYELTGPLTSLVIPGTLQDSLMARLDRLDTAKGIAQLGATIGRQFDYSLLHAVSSMDEETLQQGLLRLVETELVYQRGVTPQATYTFRHALIQDTAYQSLLRRTRQDYHQRIARALSEHFLETAEERPELLAHHCTEAGQDEAALGYWQQAGQWAQARSAHAEAVAHLQKGLALLDTLPASPERHQRELGLQIALGASLLATRGQGSADMGQAYRRAHELCRQVGDAEQLGPVLCGLNLFYIQQMEFQTAGDLAQQLLSLAQHHKNQALLVAGHLALGMTEFFLGDVSTARTHTDRGVTLYKAQAFAPLACRYGTSDAGVLCLIYAAAALGIAGYPDQAQQRHHDALSLAQDLAHPYTSALAMGWSARLSHYRREDQAVREYAEEVIALATEQGFASWLPQGKYCLGWALAFQGQGDEGIALIQQGIDAAKATGKVMDREYALAMLAEAYGQVGRPGEGLAAIAQGLALVDQYGERIYEAELYRLKGTLLVNQAVPDVPQAEACFHQALSIARHQQAKSWELRAATSLAKLWQSQDKRKEAYDLLAPVYEWFTEGFDTADLIDAKALLQELA